MKEWYLIGNKTKPNMLGGYENQAFMDYKNDAFAESLETDIADTVMLYNHDLSKFKQIRGIVQGNTADTYLKSMERCILVPIGTLHSGDYIFFENEYWIVDGRPGNNKVYEKATLKECQYKLRWQKSDGSIIERWANLTSASKYDVGESGNNTIILTSNNFTIIIPHDEDGLTIDGKRVFIDTSNNPKKVFKITRNDDALFIHGSHGGTLSLIADKTELNTTTDRPDLRLCDYIDPSTPLPPQPSQPDKTTDLCAVILGDTNLKVGFSRTYTVNFADKSGNEVDWNDIDFSWNVVSDFDSELIGQAISGNTIKLSVDDENLIGGSFILSVVVNNVILTQIEGNIMEGF